MMKEGVLKIVEQQVFKQKDKLALVGGDKEITYNQMYKYSLSFANYIDSVGIKPHQTIIIRCPLNPYVWIAYFGTVLHNAVLIMLDKSSPTSTVKEIYDKYQDVGLIISDNPEDKEVYRTITFDELEEISKREIKGKYDHFEDIGEEEVTQILFTTGTTGKSKGVSWAYPYLKNVSFITGCAPFNEQSVIGIVASINHTFSCGACASNLMRGGTVIFFEGISDVDEFYHKMEKYQINTMSIITSAMTYLLATTRERMMKHADRIVLIELAGEKLPKALAEDAIKTFKNAMLLNVFGATETGLIGTYDFSKYGVSDHRVIKVMEQPKIAFFDENKKITTASKENPAFIGCKVPFKVPGYYKEPELSKELLVDGYIVMSDLGYIDDEGFLCMIGRAGDIINSGSYKINPTDVENAALESGMVKDCVCYGISDKIFGKIVALDLVKKESYDKKAFKEYLTKHLEKYKIPKQINVTEEIVKNKIGKIDRKYYRSK